MANVEIVEVESKAQLRQFIKYPMKLYHDDPNYVTPLIQERLDFFDRSKNPFFKNAWVKLFLAMKDGEVTGRVAAIVNYKHNGYHEETTGFFGFFDTPDDYEIAHSLLKVVMIKLKQQGMDRMRGPMNFSTNHECGFLVDGYGSPPVVMMTYNHPYQVKLAEKFGLKKVMDLVGFSITDEDGIPERIQKVVNRMRERSKITIRPISMSKFNADVEKIKAVYNSAWAPNWGFVPMDEAEFDHLAKDLKQIIEPEVVLIAEHEGKPVAFSIALPDINQVLIRLKGRLFPTGLLKLIWHTKIRNKIDRVRLITFGVIPEFQKRGVDSLMFIETFNRGVKLGYSQAELSWVLETNELMCRACEQMGAKLYKKYRIVEMPL